MSDFKPRAGWPPEPPTPAPRPRSPGRVAGTLKSALGLFLRPGLGAQGPGARGDCPAVLGLCRVCGVEAENRGGLLPQVACHELCRLLGLGSCRWLRCVMQGALSLDEALRRPPDLCPVCLRKLQHVLGFKLLDRYKVSRVQAGSWESEPRAAAREPVARTC